MSSKNNPTVFVHKGFTLISRGFRPELIRIPISCSGLLVTRVEGTSREYLTRQRKRHKSSLRCPLAWKSGVSGWGWGRRGEEKRKAITGDSEGRETFLLSLFRPPTSKISSPLVTKECPILRLEFPPETPPPLPLRARLPPYSSPFNAFHAG